MDLLIGFALCIGCTRDNPAFDPNEDTQGEAGQDTIADGTDELEPETGDESTPLSCGLEGGVDMNIEFPLPCGELNDNLNLYERWFNVVGATGSTWSVQFCKAGCVEEDCTPIPTDVLVEPLPVAELAGPGSCLKVLARRLGSGDECDYHTVIIQEPAAAGRVVLLARRTTLLEFPELETGTGLAGFEPELVIDEQCDCAETPGSCCGSEAATLFAYQVGGSVIPVGSPPQTVTINQQSYKFWAFDGFRPGHCNAQTRVVWALTNSP